MRIDMRDDTRPMISALWTATMLIFAYADLFSLYRPDFPADMSTLRSPR